MEQVEHTPCEAPVNLDHAASPEELMRFFLTHQGGRGASRLFPTQGPGRVTVVSDLASYAANKATAMRLRLDGDVAKAVTYEEICDRIYEGLPAWARW